MTQHADLADSRWASFTLDQQILMIANEMHRASKLMAPEHLQRRRNAYERTLNLTDTTLRARFRGAFGRELLRWRDLVAALYVRPEPDPVAHRTALRALLLLTPVAAKQLPFVTTTNV